MTPSPIPEIMLEAIEVELQRVVQDADQSRADSLYPILAYHMGWQGEGTGKQAMGKRIRPLLLLLTCAAAGGDWENALPAAAAVELIHNFSLIHDDIEDNSPLRRGRPTVWNKWGVPLAINAGDAMFTLAHLSILRLKDTVSADKALKAAIILQNTCLDLTKGQHLDMTYETQRDLSLDDYWLMVSGKTASLISACCELGAITASAAQATQSNYKEFGYNLGMAFQALDDVLGIWGEVETTGKSADSDLVSGKKSLPVIYALSQNGSFADRWRRGSVQPQEVPQLARQLEIEGARDYTQESAACFTDKALTALASAGPTGEAGHLLSKLADQLLKRKL